MHIVHAEVIEYVDVGLEHADVRAEVIGRLDQLVEVGEISCQTQICLLGLHYLVELFGGLVCGESSSLFKVQLQLEF